MNTSTETGPGILDTVKIALSAVMLIGGIVAFYNYEQQSLLIAVVAVLVSTVLAIVVFMWSERGQTLWKFIQGSRVELRKVIWPTRQETLQTALSGMVFAFVMALFIWILDFGLLKISQQVTGEGG